MKESFVPLFSSSPGRRRPIIFSLPCVETFFSHGHPVRGLSGSSVPHPLVANCLDAGPHGSCLWVSLPAHPSGASHFSPLATFFLPDVFPPLLPACAFFIEASSSPVLSLPLSLVSTQGRTGLFTLPLRTPPQVPGELCPSPSRVFCSPLCPPHVFM